MIIKTALMKRGTTHFLRFTLFLMAVGALIFCIFALPAMWRGGPAEFPTASNAIRLIVIGLYATTVPFFIALWQTLQLLRAIDQGVAFSETSVRALKHIKQCATIIAVLYVGGVPLLFPIADADDAPGLVVIGMILACAPVVIAVFAAVLQKLLRNAIDIKSENDLTV